MESNWSFKCLRCGKDYSERYDPKGPMTERSCPECRSNSVRPIEDLDKAAAEG